MGPQQVLGEGFHRADKRAHEFSFHLRRNFVHVDALAVRKLPGVLDVVNASRLNVDRIKAGLGEFRDVFVIAECPSDASDPKFHAARHFDAGTSPRTTTSETAIVRRA